MKLNDRERNLQRFAAACLLLIPQNWLPTGKLWIFEHEGREYDLTCADLEQLQLIKAKRYFLVK